MDYQYEKCPTFPSQIKSAPTSYGTKCSAPVAHTASYQDACSPMPMGYGGAFTSLAAILVLFILLVIITRSWAI